MLKMISSPTPLRVLGIEASCDDTAVAVVDFSGDATRITKQAVIGQNNLHAAFGGVVPEIAARAHAERVDIALADAAINVADFDAIAVTTGPGLIGGLHAANAFARALARATGRPLIGVNHLAGHALTPALTDDLKPPYLMLLVSGGHCQFLSVDDFDQFTRMGSTIDDSPGEAFDKIAKILGLGYPGGPEIEREALAGDANRFALPRPLLAQDSLDFSFSGLKTAARRVRDQFVVERGGMTKQERADLCASFQMAVADVIAAKSARAVAAFKKRYPDISPKFAVAGGVAANKTIRWRLEETLSEGFDDIELIAPPLSLCTDNAAMIAFAGGVKFKSGTIDHDDLIPRPRWPLDATAVPKFGAGKKGAKA